MDVEKITQEELEELRKASGDVNLFFHGGGPSFDELCSRYDRELVIGLLYAKYRDSSRDAEEALNRIMQRGDIYER